MFQWETRKEEGHSYCDNIKAETMSESKNTSEIKDDKHVVGDDNDDDGDDENSDDSDLDDIGNIFGDDVGNFGFGDIIDPKENPLLWVQTQISRCVNPKIIVRELVPGIILPDDIPELSVWRLIFEIITEPSPRQRLSDVCSLENVIHLIKECKNILVLTGAGVSVSCGIPDFRSRNGIYARLSQDFPDLPDPHSMFDIHFFRCNPCPFFRFAKEIYPGRFAPSLSHRFIQHLEKSGRLLRNYTQNIDTLEQVAGINNVVHCHGSFATATCMNCKLKVKAGDIEADVFAQRIPYCKHCTPNTEGGMNILKPDIVFFGEGLPDEFHKKIEKDKEKADLLIVIGSSLKVRPVALIPSFLKPGIPQILINREQLPHMQFDVELYGNCDDVINEVCCQLGEEWSYITKSFVPNPLNHEKYKSFFEKKGFMQTNGYSSYETDDCRSIVTKGFCTDETQTQDGCIVGKGESINLGHSKQSTSSSYSNDTENSENSIKRKFLKIGGDCTENKRQKVPDDKISLDSNSIYYLFIPPNHYIFHGAEMECRPESEDDTTEAEHHYCNIEESKPDSIYLWKIPDTTHPSIEKVHDTTHPSIEKVHNTTHPSIEKVHNTTQPSIEKVPITTHVSIENTTHASIEKGVVSTHVFIKDVPTITHAAIQNIPVSTHSSTEKVAVSTHSSIETVSSSIHASGGYV